MLVVIDNLIICNCNKNNRIEFRRNCHARREEELPRDRADVRHRPLQAVGGRGTKKVRTGKKKVVKKK